MNFFYILSLYLLILPRLAFADFPSLNDAAMGSDELGIPEPLVFDLVRPLGSPKGELEINAFANQSSRGSELAWSPEIEYVFADGYAVELELPYANTELQEYKMALQGTFGKLMSGRMIHGWQMIGRQARQEQGNAGDLLYLNGMRLSEQISTMNMIGLRRPSLNRDKDYMMLMNTSWFYHASTRWTIGIELNNEIDHQGRWRYRLTPQAHFMINRHRAFQIGIGPSTINDDGRTEWISAARFSYSF